VAAADTEASVRCYWGECWTKGNVAAAADFYAPKYRENGEELTPQEFAAGAKSWLDKFENFSARVEKLWACGDKVVASRVRYRAKHVGDFKSVPATGKEIEITGNDVFEFDENGKVVDHWHEADHLLLYQQVGGEIRPKEHRP
jgi:predicted ester cyclase